MAMCVRARKQMQLPWIKLESQETRTGQRHRDWKEGTRWEHGMAGHSTAEAKKQRKRNVGS